MTEKGKDLKRVKAQQDAQHAHEQAAKQAFKSRTETHGVDMARGVEQDESQHAHEEQAKKAFHEKPGTHGVDVARRVAQEKAEREAEAKKDALGRNLGSET